MADTNTINFNPRLFQRTRQPEVGYKPFDKQDVSQGNSKAEQRMATQTRQSQSRTPIQQALGDSPQTNGVQTELRELIKSRPIPERAVDNIINETIPQTPKSQKQNIANTNKILSPYQLALEKQKQNILTGNSIIDSIVKPRTFEAHAIRNATSGAVLGATQDDENRIRGAILGAVGGVAMGQLKNAITGKGFKKALDYAKQTPDELIDNAKNKEWGDIKSSFGGMIRRNLTNTLGGDYHTIRDEFLQNMNNVKIELSDLQKSLDNLSDVDKQNAYLYLTGELDDVNKLSPNLKTRMDSIAEQINKNQRELLVLGRLKETSANIFDNKIDDISENWLHRTYDNKATPVSRQASMIGEDIHSRGKSEIISDEEISRRLDSGELKYEDLVKPFNDGGVKAKLLDNGKWEIRRDYTFDERTAMNEVRDISKAGVNSLFHQRKLIEQEKFLQAIKSLNPKDVEIVKDTSIINNLKTSKPTTWKAELKKEGFTQLPNTNKFGLLKGRWIRKDVAYDLNVRLDELYNFSEDLKKVINTHLMGNTLMKKSATVWNPTSHMNNMVSNGVLLHTLGVGKKEQLTGLIEYGRLMRNAERYEALRVRKLQMRITPPERAELSKFEKEFALFDEANKLWLFGRSELNDMPIKGSVFSTDNYVADGLNKVGLGENSKIYQTASKADKKLSDIYQGEDNVMRYIAYKSLKNKGYAPKDAKLATNNLLPDYNAPLPPAIRALRDTAISPFIS